MAPAATPVEAIRGKEGKGRWRKEVRSLVDPRRSGFVPTFFIFAVE